MFATVRHEVPYLANVLSNNLLISSCSSNLSLSIPVTVTTKGVISAHPGDIKAKKASAHAIERLGFSTGRRLLICRLLKMPINAASDVKVLADPHKAGPV